MAFHGKLSTDAAPMGLLYVDLVFYTDAEEIPKQINPTGLKSKHSTHISQVIRVGS